MTALHAQIMRKLASRLERAICIPALRRCITGTTMLMGSMTALDAEVVRKLAFCLECAVGVALVVSALIRYPSLASTHSVKWKKGVTYSFAAIAGGAACGVVVGCVAALGAEFFG